MTFSLEGQLPVSPHKAETPAPIGYAEAITYADAELDKTLQSYSKLLTLRHDLFQMPNSELSNDQPVEEQLYKESSYNDPLINDNLRLRAVGAEFHQESLVLNELAETDPGYGNKTTDLKQRKHTYRQAILAVAQDFGYVTKKPGVSENPFEKRLGIQASALEPIEKPVDAVIIPAAAGVSNYIRVYDALRNIASGAIKTNQIIITTGERPVSDKERDGLLSKGFRAGKNEFESTQYAFEDVAGMRFPDEIEEIPATYGINVPKTKLKHGVITINDSLIDVTVLEAAFDRERRFDNGTPNDNVTTKEDGTEEFQETKKGSVDSRANTDETFYAALPLINKEPGTLVVVSHDTWTPYQGVIANMVFGIYAQKNIIATGAFKDNRVIQKEDGSVDIQDAQAVVDEIAKVHHDLVRLRVKAENSQNPETTLIGRLTKPIPDFEKARKEKSGYHEMPIVPKPEHEVEELVDISNYSVAGQAYYSHANVIAPQGLREVPETIKVRHSIAETLDSINTLLDNPAITSFFNGQVELFVEDGHRNRQLQKDLHETLYLKHLEETRPELNEEERLALRNTLISPPSKSNQPAPHETGAAVDVVLRYKQTTGKYVKNAEVPMGHYDGNTTASTFPDFYESQPVNTIEDHTTLQFRRAFYNIMTGTAFGINTGFVVNPTEFWHWSRQDQLASKITGQTARYGLITDEDPKTT